MRVVFVQPRRARSYLFDLANCILICVQFFNRSATKSTEARNDRENCSGEGEIISSVIAAAFENSRRMIVRVFSGHINVGHFSSRTPKNKLRRRFFRRFIVIDKRFTLEIKHEHRRNLFTPSRPSKVFRSQTFGLRYANYSFATN